MLWLTAVVPLQFDYVLGVAVAVEDKRFEPIGSE